MVAALVVSAACGGSPPQPPIQPPPPPPALQAICPSGQQVQNVAGPTAPVMFVAPQVVGGVAPVSVNCTPASGAAFPLGATVVSCAVTDGAGRNTSCSFLVTLSAAPRLSVTQLLAFGDSLTAGEVQLSASAFAPLAVDPSVAYPTVLQAMLRERYLGQTINVVNRGTSGQSAVAGAASISGVLDAFKPEALLIMQGVIDISEGGTPAIAPMIQALKFDIRDAKRRGVNHVFLSTLMPVKEGIRGFGREHVIPANEEIRFLAAQEGAYLVDAYAAMIPRVSTLIGADGLHPTAEGYRVLAQAFFDEIRRRLEAPASAAPLGRRR